MNTKYLVICIAFLVLAISAEEYQLLANLSQGLDNKWEKLATVELKLGKDDGSGYITTDKLHLIPRNLIQDKQNRYLQLKLASNSIQAKEFITTVDLVQNFPQTDFKEIVEINVDEENNINSFSYVVKPVVAKKNKKKIEKDDEDIDETFKVLINKQYESLKSMFSPPTRKKQQQNRNQNSQQSQSTNQNNQSEEQPQQTGIMGFIQNNIWYIVIGLIVFQFVSGAAGQEAGAAGQGQGRPVPR